MKISELRAGQGSIEVEAEVVDKDEVREFNKFGRTGKVATARIKDDSGEMALTLWNEDVDRVNIGDKIKVSNGFVKEFQGEKQLTAGRFGKIEIQGKEEAAEAEEAVEAEPVAEKAEEEEEKAEEEEISEEKAEEKEEEEESPEEPTQEEKVE